MRVKLTVEVECEVEGFDQLETGVIDIYVDGDCKGADTINWKVLDEEE